MLTTNQEAAAKALELVQQERKRQDDKWGVQTHHPFLWMAIANEEVGEVAKAYLQERLGDYRTELVQATAVLLAWLECEIQREDPNADES